MSLYLTMVHLVGSHLPLLVRSCLMRLYVHPSLPPFCRVLALCVLLTLSLKEGGRRGVVRGVCFFVGLCSLKDVCSLLKLVCFLQHVL